MFLFDFNLFNSASLNTSNAGNTENQSKEKCSKCRSQDAGAPCECTAECRGNRKCMMELRKSLFQCRDFELNALWSRSLFIWVFLLATVTGYGYVFIHEHEPGGNAEMNFLLLKMLFSFLIAFLGTLFFFMARASKYWYEIYEKKINIIENKNLKDCIPERLRNDQCDGPGSFFPISSAYRISPSKINILIGFAIMVLGAIMFLCHFYSFASQVSFKELIDIPDSWKQFFWRCVAPVFILIVMFILSYVFVSSKGSRRGGGKTDDEKGNVVQVCDE